MLLSVENLWVFYGPIEALHDVSINVNEGEIVSIIGHNGAGKSTLLKSISCLLKPTSGQIVYDGKTINGTDPDKIVSMGISHVPEGRQIFASLTVYDNLMAGSYTRKDTDGVKKDIDMYCQRFPILGQRLHQRAGYLSGGEQQMLAIARALMSRPKILLMDEPSLGLAPVVVKEVYRIIEEIRKDGTAILLVEQNANKALNVSDRAYVLASGQIELTGSGKEMAENDDVRRIYLGV